MCSDPHACSPRGGSEHSLPGLRYASAFLQDWAFCLCLGRTGIALRQACLPTPVRLQLHRGVATLITLLSAELNVNHRPINDHGNSWGFDAVMHLEIGEVTA